MSRSTGGAMPGARSHAAGTARPPGIASARGLAGSVLACALGVAVVAAASDESLPVILPMMAAVAVAAIGVGFAWARSGDAPPVFEIGVVYTAFVTLYTVYPLFGFWTNGLRYTPLSDDRLFRNQPTVGEIGTVGWYHVVHLAAFLLVYLVVRGRPAPGRRPFPGVEVTTLVPVLFGYTLILLFFGFLGLYFDLSARSYTETYLVSKRLPLFLAQLANHLGGARFTLELVILAALFGDYRRRRGLIAAWLLASGAVAFVRLGGRTDLVLLALSAVMMYHYAVRPIRLGQMVVSGTAGLLLFLGLGFLRGGRLADVVSGPFLTLFGHGNEFETIFGNAYDVGRLQAQGRVGELPLAFYAADLLALVPQQLIPGVKISPVNWYAETFHPVWAAMGGAFAFGTVSESILGGGWIDLVGRGAALGLALALIHRWHCRRRPTCWGIVFYVWATVLCYQLFRITTFSLLVLFVYRFLPVMLAVQASATVLKGIRRGDRPAMTPDAGRA